MLQKGMIRQLGGESRLFYLGTWRRLSGENATRYPFFSAFTHAACHPHTLVGIAAQRTAPQSARVASATAILDLGWGKPNQEIELNQ